MSLKLVTPASALAVSLAEAKLHLRVDGTDEDTLITSMITAATETAEQITGRAIMPQTWLLTLDAFEDELVLTRVPVASIVSVTYTDPDGVELALSTGSNWRLLDLDDYAPARIVPVYGYSWPATRAQAEVVGVEYVAGYANAAAVPEPIKAWIKLTVSAMYENREAESYSTRAVSTTVKMSFVDALLDRYKVYQ